MNMHHARTDVQAFRIPVLAIVGVGLIGGSLALSLKHHAGAGEVLGISHDPVSLQKAL